MRIASAIFAVAFAALAVLAAPVQAKNSNAPKASDQAAAADCNAYEQAPNGEWRPVPCQEGGSSAQTQHKPPAGSSADATH